MSGVMGNNSLTPFSKQISLFWEENLKFWLRVIRCNHYNCGIIALLLVSSEYVLFSVFFYPSCSCTVGVYSGNKVLSDWPQGKLWFFIVSCWPHCSHRLYLGISWEQNLLGLGGGGKRGSHEVSNSKFIWGIEWCPIKGWFKMKLV